MPDTYAEFQASESSEKIAIAAVQASERLVGWTVHSGSVYKRTSFTRSVIVSMEQAGTALTEVASVAAVVAGTYFNDRANREIYVRCSSDQNPNSVFLSCTFKLFFASAPGVNLPHDLSTGFDVPWRNLIQSSSAFGVDLDTNEFIGIALEGAGTISFLNDLEFWQPLFDVVTLDNKDIEIYSYGRGLPVSEVKKIYKGRIVGRSWDRGTVRLQLRDQLNQLRGDVPLARLSELSGVTLPENFQQYRQRLVYGIVHGHRPQNIDHPGTEGDTLTGTVSVTDGDATVAGSGTSFLSQVLPDDEIDFGDGTRYTVASVTSNTAFELSEDFDGSTASGLTMTIFRQRPTAAKNRTFLVAGHALKVPSTTIESAYTSRRLKFTSVDGFFAETQVSINGETRTVESVSPTTRTVVLTQGLTTFPSPGDAVSGLSIWKAYLDDRQLTYTRDYTIDAANGKMSLTSTAEFNIAPVLNVQGTVTFTNTSRAVTGSGTAFKDELEPGDWIRSAGQADYFQVLSIESDTALTLRSAATYTAAAGARRKRPAYYSEGDIVLSCSVLGKTEDGTVSGTLISTAAGIAEDLLDLGGLGDSLNTASFTAAKLTAPQVVGLAVPEKFDADESGALRDIVSKVNQSVFGSVYQTQDFEIAYKVFEPNRTSDIVSLAVKDILNMGVQVDSANIFKTATVQYNAREHDALVGSDSFSSSSATSDTGNYLVKSDREFTKETRLVYAADAGIMSSRWAFIKSIANTTIRIALKMKGQTMNIHDNIDVVHDDLFYSLGVLAARRLALVSSYKRTASGVDIELNDLSNAFNRCSIITANDANTYEDATDEEKARNGYITDTYGMMDNDPDTYGKNLIW